MNVLVTRPGDAAAPLLDALTAQGHVPLHEPLLQIEPLPDATLDLAGAQALLLTSAAGVRAAAALTPERGIPVFTVGGPTARAAAALGFRTVTAAGGNAEAMLALLLARLDPAAGRVVHASGAEIARDLIAALAPHGFSGERSVVYRARAATALSPTCLAALDSGSIDAAMFHSPRMARTFVALIQAAGRRAACKTVTALALSAAVADALDGVAWERILIAAASEDAAMLTLLAPAEGDAA